MFKIVQQCMIIHDWWVLLHRLPQIGCSGFTSKTELHNKHNEQPVCTGSSDLPCTKNYTSYFCWQLRFTTQRYIISYQNYKNVSYVNMSAMQNETISKNRESGAMRSKETHNRRMFSIYDGLLNHPNRVPYGSGDLVFVCCYSNWKEAQVCWVRGAMFNICGLKLLSCCWKTGANDLTIIQCGFLQELAKLPKRTAATPYVIFSSVHLSEKQLLCADGKILDSGWDFKNICNIILLKSCWRLHTISTTGHTCELILFYVSSPAWNMKIPFVANCVNSLLYTQCLHYRCHRNIVSREDFTFIGFDLRDHSLFSALSDILPGVTMVPPRYHTLPPPLPSDPTRYFLSFRGVQHDGIEGSSFVRRDLRKVSVNNFYP